MKVQVTALLAIVLFASTSMAQYSTVADLPARDGYSAKGVRVSLVKPSLTFEIKDADYKEALDSSLGIAVGYANLPVQSLGWTGNAAYIDFKEQEGGGTIMRADGSLAYAFTEQVNVKGGINFSTLSVKDSNFTTTAGIGFQAGVGFQITRNIGLDLSYVTMKQTANTEDGSIGIGQSGPEFALNGTF